MEQKSSEFSKLRVYPHWVSASADNAGLWWRLGVGLGPICKRHHRPALTADADTAANLINHWSMKWDQFKDPISHLCLAGSVVASWSLRQEVAGSNPFHDKYFWSLNLLNPVKIVKENSIILDLCADTLHWISCQSDLLIVIAIWFDE